MPKSATRKDKRAAKAAKRAARLTATLAESRRAEEEHARRVLAGEIAPTRRRAMLIINTKSGPNDDSIMRVREVVEELARHEVEADVRVKLRKKQARKLAKGAAKDGYDLVIAAGGDGTIEAVARGLIGRKIPLGIVPLGTYNNLAASLGVPLELPAACALIGTGVTRAIDVGYVQAAGARKPKPFLELASVGLSAAMLPAGQEAKDGNWLGALGELGSAASAAPSKVWLTLDGAAPREVEALMLQVWSAPRAGPAVVVTPQARMDDGTLDVALYRDTNVAALAALFAAELAGVGPGDRVESSTAAHVAIRADPPLPVAADSKLVGDTPAEVWVEPGALLVIAGAGFGLAHPVAPALVDAAVEIAAAPEPARAGAPAGVSSPADVADSVARAAPAPTRPLVRQLVRWLGG